jgi:molecular chaperone GrpE (heat shock protein)
METDEKFVHDKNPQNQVSQESGKGNRHDEAVSQAAPDAINTDLETLVNFNVESLKLELPGFSKPPRKNVELTEIVEEVADDMLDIIKKIGQIENKITLLGSTVQYLQQLVENSSKSIVIEIDRIKEILISDRKEFTSRSTLNALIPTLESLRFIEEISVEEKDNRLRKQSELIRSVLTGLIQMLGYREHEAKTGTDFDPFTMRCMGYDDGEPGKVIRTVYPGYISGNLMVKPCGVILGKKTNTQNTVQQSSTIESKENSHE